MSDVARKPSRRKSTPLKVSSKSGQGDAGENNPTDTHSVSGGSKEKERENQRERSESNGKIEPAASHAVDGLVAAIGEHDRFFSTMLDMIPENLVLPAKEVPEAAYASKYMKVRGESCYSIHIVSALCDVEILFDRLFRCDRRVLQLR